MSPPGTTAFGSEACPRDPGAAGSPRTGTIESHSISAGLDYPGVGPEHSYLHDIGRAEYRAVTDAEALDAFQLCARMEGIIPALEPAHALAHVMKLAPTMRRDQIIVMNMCGRGDKDVFTVGKIFGFDL